MREIRERAAEAAIAHTLSDVESEIALLSLGLEDEFNALQRLGQVDPVGVAMFGDRPGWIERQLARQDALSQDDPQLTPADRHQDWAHQRLEVGNRHGS